MNLAAITTTAAPHDFLASEYNHQAFTALLNPFRCYLSLLPESRQGNNMSYPLYVEAKTSEMSEFHLLDNL